MMSVELRRRIAEELEVELPATLLFDYPTLGKMRNRVIEVAVADADFSSTMPRFGLRSARSSADCAVGDAV